MGAAVVLAIFPDFRDKGLPSSGTWAQPTEGQCINASTYPPQQILKPLLHRLPGDRNGEQSGLEASDPFRKNRRTSPYLARIHRRAPLS
jgi:hypothetical protein